MLNWLWGVILLGRCDAPQQRANAENTIYNINSTADIDELIRRSWGDLM